MFVFDCVLEDVAVDVRQAMRFLQNDALNPNDFHFWSDLKNIVYTAEVNTEPRTAKLDTYCCRDDPPTYQQT